ncbi:LCP family protein [Saccharomonospora sp.]|uniref:LCP family protein n=1 Tax=Saccharomonospora sp. TaxID=33913 RepID=UPI00260B9217|nr:LCP family protein [Saccharomonospora sp.]
MTDGAREPLDTPDTQGRSRLRTIGLISGRSIISLLSVVVLALTAYGWQMIGTAQSNLATTNVFDDKEPGAEPLDGAIDILLVGMDSRTDAQGNPLPQEVLDMLHAGEDEDTKQTDTMILVHIPQDGTSATAISFPRDSWVELAGGYGNNRLNTAFRFAYNDTLNTLRAQGETDTKAMEAQAEAEGRKNLIATIEQLVGRPGMIDRYAEVNLASFYEITKVVGGIEVCLKEPAKEAKSGIDLPAGRQTIEGVQALAFVRQRTGLPRSDLDRINRQQAFLSGLARKMLSGDILLNPSRLSEVISAVQKSVIVSEDWDLLEFANQMRSLSGGQIEFHTVPVVQDMMIGGASVLQVDPQQIGEFVDELIPEEREGDPRMDTVPETVPGAENYTVHIYDATAGASLGEDTRALLSSQGFGGESYARAEQQNSTAIYHAPGEQAGADALRTALGADLAAEADPQLAPGTLSLHLGEDFTLPAMPRDIEELGGMQPLSGGAGLKAQQQPGPGEGAGEAGTTESDEESAGSEEAEDGPITAGGVPCVY